MFFNILIYSLFRLINSSDASSMPLKRSIFSIRLYMFTSKSLKQFVKEAKSVGLSLIFVALDSFLTLVFFSYSLIWGKTILIVKI